MKRLRDFFRCKSSRVQTYADGSVDEIYAEGTIHIECMNECHVYLCINDMRYKILGKNIKIVAE